MSMDRERSENMRSWLVLITFFILTDQATKIVAQTLLSEGESIEAVPFFNFLLVYNKGAAFSFLSDAGGWQRWFFIFLASAVCIYLLVWLRNIKRTQRFLGIGLTFVLSGALGNLIDRILHGKVTDFLDFYYVTKNDCLPFFFRLPPDTCHWPTFNVADILISVGAILLLVQITFDSKSTNEAD